MTKYVIDSCVAVKWVIPEVDFDKAIRFRNDYLTGATELIAPDVFPVEVAYPLTRAERQGRIAVSEAAQFLHDVLATGPALDAYLPLLSRAVDISSAARMGVYDCLYVALAEREGCELVTADDKLLKNLGPNFPFIVALSSLP